MCVQATAANLRQAENCQSVSVQYSQIKAKCMPVSKVKMNLRISFSTAHDTKESSASSAV